MDNQPTQPIQPLPLVGFSFENIIRSPLFWMALGAAGYWYLQYSAEKKTRRKEIRVNPIE